VEALLAALGVAIVEFVLRARQLWRELQHERKKMEMSNKQQ
jgi:hypothetical protein